MPVESLHPVLVFIDAGHARHVTIDGPLKIGRAKDCDVVLDHPTVSRHHATIELDPAGRAWIVDHNSANGTRLAGKRINGRARLDASTRLRFGQLTTWFYLDPKEANTPTPRPTGEDGVLFRCTHCQARLWAGRSMVGKQLPCRKCKHPNTVPAESLVEPAGETVSGLEFLDDPEAADDTTPSRCGVCRWTLSGRVTVCPGCSAAYHEDCWTANHGCATYGCPQVNSLAPDSVAIPSAERPLSPLSNVKPPLPPPRAWMWLLMALVAAAAGLVTFGVMSLVGALACAVRLRRGGLDRPSLLGVGMAACLLATIAGLVISAKLWFDSDVLAM